VWKRSISVTLVLILLASTLGVFGASAAAGDLRNAPIVSVSGQIPHMLAAANPMLSASLTVSPNSINEGASITVTATASGGNPSPSYSYSYTNFPSGCTGGNSQMFTCTPTETGSFSVSVTVSDNNGNMSTSPTMELSVSSSSGNGNGNGNGNSGSNNSSNPFSSLLSGFSGVLSLLIIAGIIGFVTWILLIVGVWIIAVVLIRRLPKRGALAAGAVPAFPMKCASCSAEMPAGSKFCPACGTSTVPKTP
jgi:hypothetical protein